MASKSPGKARLEKSTEYGALVKTTVADQEKALAEVREPKKKAAAREAKGLPPIKAKKKTIKAVATGNGDALKLVTSDGELIADPKKEGIPLFLQTQNRKPLAPEEEKRVEEFMKKKTQEQLAIANPADAKAIEELTGGLNKDQLKTIRNNNRFSKLAARKENEAAITAGALWDTRTARWILPPTLATKAKELTVEYNKLVGKLREMGIMKWKYRAETFLDVKEAEVKIGVLKAKLEGREIAENHESKEPKRPGKRRAVHSGPRKKDWAVRPAEDDEALLGRSLAIGVDVKRQEGAARTLRWLEAVAHLKKHPKATLGEIVKTTSYTVADYRHDIERGALKS